ncbi:MAG: hypothetical protein D1H97_20025 [Paracoccus sp. BP8]|nr:MAG: hypothetical protein D1H97_20025 [Paracoccus sp. BP8]
MTLSILFVTQFSCIHKIILGCLGRIWNFHAHPLAPLDFISLQRRFQLFPIIKMQTYLSRKISRSVEHGFSFLSCSPASKKAGLAIKGS